ncbi:transglutaminase-like domain-containing protein [Georgenia sp. Z1491]|uniref:transglutaminase-like domain-containing protein n=1 Tax=Georgenia sp. Z1491 TaxID=3416707 RepID=UPI003CE7B71C
MNAPSALEEGRRTREASEALAYRGDAPTRAALRRRARMRVWDAVAVPLLMLLALAPLWPAYGVGRFVVLALLAVAAGSGIALLSAWRRWGALVTLLAVLLALVLLTGVAAPVEALVGWLPTPASIGAVGQGVVTSWKDLVTILAPVGATGAVLTVPLVVGVVGSALAMTIAQRTRRPTLAALVPLAVLPGSVLLGTRDTGLAVPVGLAFAVVALVWASRRSNRLHTERPVATAVLLVVALVAGGVTGLLWQDEDRRTVVRDHVAPPPDLRDYPSPLAGFRAYLKDHLTDTVLTVDGLEPGELVRLAAMDSYDGTAFTVAPGGEAGTGEFQRIGAAVEEGLPGAEEIDVTIGEYRDVWVPVAGRISDITFTSERSTDLARSLYVNPVAGVGLVEAGLRPGDRYTLLAAPVERPDLGALSAAPVDDRALPPVTVPDSIATEASILAADATTTLARIQAVESGLRQGYFSHGLEGDTPSLAGHGAARLDAMLTGPAMVGDQEQYAALMALMLRSMQIPARVVIGFEVPNGTGAIQVAGEDVTAWVEVPFEQYGWVPFFPTPDEDRIWQEQNLEPQEQPQPQVLQPPPPVLEPPDAPPAARQDVDVREEPDERESRLSIVWVIVAAAGGGLLLLLLAPVVVILAWKATRRRRRRTRGTTTHRAVGGWSEIVDVTRDLGALVPGGATRSVAAGAVERSLGGSGGAGPAGSTGPGAAAAGAGGVGAGSAGAASSVGRTATGPGGAAWGTGRPVSDPGRSARRRGGEDPDRVRPPGSTAPGGGETAPDGDAEPGSAAGDGSAVANPIDLSAVDLRGLARRTDAQAFGYREPDDRDVEKLWAEVDETLERMRAAAGRRRWWRSRLSTRSLRRRRGRRQPGSRP